MSVCLYKSSFLKKSLSLLVLITFGLTSGIAPSFAQLPPVGQMFSLTSGYEPPILRGMTVHAENPLLFDFIVDRGQDMMADGPLKAESEKLIKYFLASMTIPDKDAWVNLSPFEKNRIIPEALGQTEMGKTMLEQDYMLKQLAASLTNPDTELGKEYWAKVGNGRDRSLQDLSKVWIVPAGATVVEKDGFAYITESKLDVKMEEDYEKKGCLVPGSSCLVNSTQEPGTNHQEPATAVFRSLILPKLIQEVNEGKTFAPTRQVYQSVILASWYKKALKDSLLGKVYADKSKIEGITTDEKDIKQKVYDQYLEAFKKGVYNVIKEEEVGDETVPRKYFSGGEYMKFDLEGESNKGRGLTIVTGSSAAVNKMAKSLRSLGNRIVVVLGRVVESLQEKDGVKPNQGRRKILTKTAAAALSFLIPGAVWLSQNIKLPDYDFTKIEIENKSRFYRSPDEAAAYNEFSEGIRKLVFLLALPDAKDFSGDFLEYLKVFKTRAIVSAPAPKIVLVDFIDNNNSPSERINDMPHHISVEKSEKGGYIFKIEVGFIRDMDISAMLTEFAEAVVRRVHNLDDIRTRDDYVRIQSGIYEDSRDFLTQVAGAYVRGNISGRVSQNVSNKIIEALLKTKDILDRKQNQLHGFSEVSPENSPTELSRTAASSAVYKKYFPEGTDNDTISAVWEISRTLFSHQGYLGTQDVNRFKQIYQLSMTLKMMSEVLTQKLQGQYLDSPPYKRPEWDGKTLILGLLSQGYVSFTDYDIGWALLSTLWKYPQLLSAERTYDVLNALSDYVAHFGRIEAEYRNFEKKFGGQLEEFTKYYLFLRSIANDAVFGNINIDDAKKALQLKKESDVNLSELWDRIKMIDPTIVDIISQEADHYYGSDGIKRITQYMLYKILEDMVGILAIPAGRNGGSVNSSSALVNSRERTMREEIESFTFANRANAENTLRQILTPDNEPGNFEEQYQGMDPEKLKARILYFIDQDLFSQDIFTQNRQNITEGGVKIFLNIISGNMEKTGLYSDLNGFFRDFAGNSLLADKGMAGFGFSNDQHLLYREARALVREILIRSGVTEDFINDYFARPPAETAGKSSQNKSVGLKPAAMTARAGKSAGKESKIKASAPGVPEDREATSDKVGGIDFDPSNLNLQIKRDGKGVPLPLPQQDVEHIDIKGLFPVILEILPANAQTLPILGKIELNPAPVTLSKS